MTKKPYYNESVNDAIKKNTGFDIGQSVVKQDELFAKGLFLSFMTLIAFVAPLFVTGVLGEELSRTTLFISVAASGLLGIGTGSCAARYVNEGLKKTESVSASAAVSADKIADMIERKTSVSKERDSQIPSYGVSANHGGSHLKDQELSQTSVFI